MSAYQVPGTLAAKELERMARDPAVFSFPGFFPGLLDSRAGTVNDDMKLAAARAIATCVRARELGEECIIPSVFNKSVVPAVAEAVARVGVKPARRPASARESFGAPIAGTRGVDDGLLPRSSPNE